MLTPRLEFPTTSRITSYNVCYTKLLRNEVGIQAEAVAAADDGGTLHQWPLRTDIEERFGIEKYFMKFQLDGRF